MTHEHAWIRGDDDWCTCGATRSVEDAIRADERAKVEREIVLDINQLSAGNIGFIDPHTVSERIRSGAYRKGAP